MSTPRKGDWIQTVTGRQFWPLDPRPEDVVLEDLAHGVAGKFRFGAQTPRRYTVAQHLVLVSVVAQGLAAGAGFPPEAVLYVGRWGLVHDGSDAYLPDVPRPVKYLPEMAPFREAEARMQQTICTWLGLGHFEPSLVKLADQRLCVTEARDLFERVHPEWVPPCQPPPEPLLERIVPWTPEEAKEQFLTRFLELWPGGAP